MRLMASKVLKAIQPAGQEETGDGSPVMSGRRLSEEVFSSNVCLMDGTAFEVVYSSVTLVSDALEQLAWTLGLPRLKHFALYVDNGDEHIRLDEKKFLSELFRSKGGVQHRLVFKKELYRRKDKAITDPDYVYYSYLQSKHQYLHGGYPVDKEHAVHLCTLQILAEHESSIFESPDALSKAIYTSIPEQVGFSSGYGF